MLFYVFGIIAVLAVIGSLLETYQPHFFSETFKRNMSAITLGFSGILLSMWVLLLLLKSGVREGFEEKEVLQNWKQVVRYYKLEDLCKIYPDIYNKIIVLEKGPPPSIVTDAQARERATKTFEEEMRTTLFSCQTLKKLTMASNVDSLFEGLYSVENDFLVKAYETALACKELLIRQYNQVQSAKERRKEGFQSRVLCDQEVAVEKRKAMKDKEKELQKQTCALPEEIPQNEKEEFAKKKIALLASMLETHRKKYNLNDSMEKVLQDCQYYISQLEADKEAAQKGTIGTSKQTPSVPGF